MNAIVIGVNELRHLYISNWKKNRVIAAIDQNEPVAFYICRDDEEAVGSIYKGIVKTYKSNIHAYFIDIGEETELYLHESDCLDASEMHVGDEIIVQTVKESSRNKSRQATMYVSLVGECLIYSPFMNYIAISKKLSESDREKWERLGNEWKQGQEGFIIRTAVLTSSKEKVKNELHELRKQMNKILESGKQSKAPARLFEGRNFIEQIATRYHSYGFTSIFTDHPDVYKTFNGKLQQSLTLVETPPFQLEKEIQKAMKNIVWMQDGSYLLIEENESLTVVDVNSGHSSLTPFVINKHAAIEAMRQLRLRNISGMVVIDFLRMNKDERKYIKKIIEDLAKQDVHTISIFGYSRMGLFELTRKKIGQALKDAIDMGG